MADIPLSRATEGTLLKGMEDILHREGTMHSSKLRRDARVVEWALPVLLRWVSVVDCWVVCFLKMRLKTMISMSMTRGTIRGMMMAVVTLVVVISVVAISRRLGLTARSSFTAERLLGYMV